MDEGHTFANNGEYQSAYDIFHEVAGWTYHEEYAEVDELEPAYYAATALFAMGKYGEANKAFSELGDYSDSLNWVHISAKAPIYEKAVKLYNDEKYKEAKAIFDSIPDIADSADYSKKCTEQLTGDTSSKENSIDESSNEKIIYSSKTDMASIEDMVGAFSDTEKKELLELAEDLALSTGFEFRIVTAFDIGDLSTEEYAREYYYSVSEGNDGGCYFLDFKNQLSYFWGNGLLLS